MLSAGGRLSPWAGVRRQIFFRASGAGSLKLVGPAALQRHTDSTIVESGLGKNAQEINPGEILDKLTLVKLMGGGGIPLHHPAAPRRRITHPLPELLPALTWNCGMAKTTWSWYY